MRFFDDPTTDTIRDVEIRHLVSEFIAGRIECEKGSRQVTLHRIASAVAWHMPDLDNIEALTEAAMKSFPSEPEGSDYWTQQFLKSHTEAKSRDPRRMFAETRTNADNDWVQILELDKAGAPMRTLTNLRIILDNDPILSRCVFNVRSGEIECPENDYFKHQVQQYTLSWYLAQKYNWSGPESQVIGMFGELVVARERDPVKDYLVRLQWDGVKRVRKMFQTYAMTEGNDAYFEEVAKCFMVGAVARTLKPGCKHDSVLVFSGPQGIGKSSFGPALAGDWSGTQTGTLFSRDARQSMSLGWFVELGELSSLRKGKLEAVKAFITESKDEYRAPYAKLPRSVPRRFVFYGSTNDSLILSDTTGNRRFWVIPVERLDITSLTRDRDQLWAEAVQMYVAGEKWWLEGEYLRAQAEENEMVSEDLPFQDVIEDWIRTTPLEKKSKGIYVAEFCCNYLNVPIIEANDGSLQRIMARSLRALGFVRRRTIVDEIRQYRWYYKPNLSKLLWSGGANVGAETKS